MSKLMTGVSGVRGIFAQTLDPMVAMRFAATFGEFIKADKAKATIVVGRDSRTTGQVMNKAIISALMGVGCDVIDIGIVATPTVLLNVQRFKADGGIAITASHNPPEWNAMKLIDGDGMFLAPQRSAAYLASVDAPITWQNWQHVGKCRIQDDAIRYHIDKILNISYLDVEAIRSKRFKVVVDSVNGAGGLISPILLEKLGCEVVLINEEPSGHFAHPAEPLNENLKQLEEAVKKHGADLGFATDPDVDRLSIVNEHGECIGEELSVVLAQLFVLPKHKGDIVVNLSSSMLSDDVAARFGVKVHRTRVGEINVGKKMQALKSPIGGEGNGGIICPEVNYTRDAVAGMALILGLLAQSGKTVSQWQEELPKYYFAKSKMEVDPKQMDAIMAKVPKLFAEHEIDTQDGVKVIAKDWWIHIRKSGTEPIIRIYVESPDPARSEEICNETIEKLKK
ncbi:MAG TPA: phosphoglucosamine mutase [Candidatus Cloacimonas sp.]|jgi:phosphomannomutase|nr:phosphoglucosamine mutase [Candidatus Cloacimonas sp.]